MSAELLRYWPNETDLGACIKTVAEASSEAVAPLKKGRVDANTSSGDKKITTKISRYFFSFKAKLPSVV